MTIQFKTPAEYRAHLRQIISDSALVEKCVRTKFPPVPKALGEAAFHGRGHSKPSASDGDYFRDTDDRYKERMALNNDRFIRTLWTEHGPILKVLRAKVAIAGER